MEMSSTRSVPASVETTWEALNDPEVLKACIPGCESIERVADTEYKVAMLAKVGPVNARFNGRMTLSDLDPPRAYSIAFEGQGGAAGFAKGAARVQLAPDPVGTQMSYQVNAQVGGKLAQIGSRLVDGAAKKYADDFFSAFAARLGQPAVPEAVPGAAGAAVPGELPGAPPAGPAGVPSARPGPARNKILLWAVVIIVLLIAFFATR